MEEFEVGLMLSLCSQLIDLLSPEAAGPEPEDDPDDDPDDDPETEERGVHELFDDVIHLSDVPVPPAQAGDTPEVDPFALWEQELDAHRPEAERPTDPVMLRLFPDAYAGDPEASAEFRRYTEPDQRQRKIDEALVVLSCLEASERGHRPVKVGAEQVDPWLRTLTALRLVIAERLGITPETPQGDPDAVMPEARDFMHEVYDWLAFVQESLLLAL